MPDPLIIAYDSTRPKPKAIFTNEVYAFMHRSSIGLGMPNTRAKMVPAIKTGEYPGSREADGFHILVLLPKPITAICTETGMAHTFQAAILREYAGHAGEDGQVEGWLINSCAAALEQWKQNYPEASAP